VGHAIPDASPDNQGVTLGVLLPIAFRTLKPDYNKNAPLGSKCIKATVIYSDRSVPKIIKFGNQPARYAEETLKRNELEFLTDFGVVAIGISKDQTAERVKQGDQEIKEWTWGIPSKREQSHSMSSNEQSTSNPKAQPNLHEQGSSSSPYPNTSSQVLENLPIQSSSSNPKKPLRDFYGN
jgi:hypothetical protein